MINITSMRKIARFTIGIVFTFLMTSSAWSTSIQKLSFQQLAEQSEMVFDGEVIAVDASWNDARTQITTTVKFRVNEVVSGSFNGDELSLNFMGGTVGDMTMEVEAMRYPQLGERGVYFVESSTINMVNPLLGWSQGHFKVDQGQIMDASGQPVEAITNGEVVPSGTLSNGIASGVKLKDKGSTSENSLSLIEFKDIVRAVSAKSMIDN